MMFQMVHREFIIKEKHINMKLFRDNKFNMRYALLFVLILFRATITPAQNAFIPLSNSVQQIYDPYLDRVGTKMHTSTKPYLESDLRAETPFDSLNKNTIKETKFTKTLVGRKIFSEDLLFIEKENFKLYLNPVFEFSGGRDQDNDINFYTNQRGFWAHGSVGKRFSFSTNFYENQSTFANYLDSSINKTRIVPGQGRVKQDGKIYDYSNAIASVTYQCEKNFTFTFGNEKNFIGDGYRSLLLSDNSFNYPSLKMVLDVWKIRYQTIFAVMQDLTNDNPSADDPFDKKYGAFHYIDFNIGKHASIGLFEAIIWHGDSTGNRGFELAYMNPLVFLRPTEFGLGSPDNALLGMNAKVKINSKNLVYGQIMLDEFLLDEVKAGNGWWGNKQGVQLGFKSYDLFKVKNLFIQGEFNYIRPYTYTHRESMGNYGHYRSALAHPLGANLWEAIGIARYTYKELDLYAKISLCEVGYDTAGTNVGQDIYISYEENRQDYDNKVGQGDTHKILWVTFNANYVFNPKTRLSLFAEVSLRNVDAEVKGVDNTTLFQFGLKTRLFNRYYDF